MTLSSSPSSGAAGDVITYTLVLNACGGKRRRCIPTVVVSNTLPVSMTYVTGSLTSVSGPAPTSMSGGATISAAWDSFALAQTSSLEFRATLNTGIANEIDTDGHRRGHVDESARRGHHGTVGL